MKNSKFHLCHTLVCFLMGSLLLGCTESEPEPAQPYDEGVLVINSGNFLDNNGSISFLKRTDTKPALDIFQQVNKRPLTGGVQGYLEADGKGLILVDNSSPGQDRIEVVDPRTFGLQSVVLSSDIENPRYAARVARNKVYVTCWGATGSGSNFFANPGYVAVIDLTDPTKRAKKIPMQRGAEGIVVVGNRAFVGGVGGENLIQIIDTDSDTPTEPIRLEGAAGQLALDANNKIWAFVGRKAVRINPDTRAVEANIPVGIDTRKTPGNLTPGLDRRTFYFTYTFYDPADNYREKGELYRFSITDTAIPASQPIARRVFSGLGVDPGSNLLYAGFTPSFRQSGYVFRMQPDGRIVDSVQVEIAPSHFWFK